MLDANVQKVVNAGFSLDVAEWALRNSKNDPVKAIKELRAVSSCASLSTSSLLSIYNENYTQQDSLTHSIIHLSEFLSR